MCLYRKQWSYHICCYEQHFCFKTKNIYYTFYYAVLLYCYKVFITLKLCKLVKNLLSCTVLAISFSSSSSNSISNSSVSKLDLFFFLISGIHIIFHIVYICFIRFQRSQHVFAIPVYQNRVHRMPPIIMIVSLAVGTVESWLSIFTFSYIQPYIAVRQKDGGKTKISYKILSVYILAWVLKHLPEFTVVDIVRII